MPLVSTRMGKTCAVRGVASLMAAAGLTYVLVVSALQLSLVRHTLPSQGRRAIGVGVTDKRVDNPPSATTRNDVSTTGGGAELTTESVGTTWRLRHSRNGPPLASSKHSLRPVNPPPVDNEADDPHPFILLRKLKEKRPVDGSSGDRLARSGDHRHHLHHGGEGQDSDPEEVNFLSLGDLYIYAAYVDQRLPGPAQIRLFVLRPTLNHTGTLACRFLTSNNRTRAVTARAYEMCENHSKEYGGWIYSCTMPDSIDPHLLRTVNLSIFRNTSLGQATLESVPVRPLRQAPRGVRGEPHTHQDAAGPDEDIELNVQDNITSKRADFPSERWHMRESGNTTTATQDKALSIGVCVPPLHAAIYLSQIINFIEFCRILGASNIFLYIHDVSKDILLFLRRYSAQNKGFLSLIQWNLPVIKTSSSWPSPSSPAADQVIWNHGQLLSIQHCLYNNMDNSDWLLFMDTDEMLVPRGTTSWAELIRHSLETFSNHHRLKGANTVTALSFDSAYFQQDFQTVSTNSIPYFQYLHRTRDTSARRAKLMVRPGKTFEVGIHHLSKPLTEQSQVLRVSPSAALLHHYRKCMPDVDSHDIVQCEILVKDENIMKYEPELILASRKVLKDAMKFFAPKESQTAH